MGHATAQRARRKKGDFLDRINRIKRINRMNKIIDGMRDGAEQDSGAGMKGVGSFSSGFRQDGIVIKRFGVCRDKSVPK